MSLKKRPTLKNIIIIFNLMGKIYTKSGDTGETSLIGGKRVSKASDRVNAYGDIDEANAFIGIIISSIKYDDIKQLLQEIQKDLFVLSSDLADPSYPDNPYNIPRVEEYMISKIEKAIDSYNEELSELSNFILPGGSIASSLLHYARAVIRRAERSIVRLNVKTTINPLIIKYVNRLSDLLFILARVANKREGINDIIWTKY
jgi:cob(I)alamin adenosyltransferase